MYFFDPSTIQVKEENRPYQEQIQRLKKQIRTAEAIVVGAGAGLSTAAGLTYNGSRFKTYFFDFANKYNIQDMYSGGFYPFDKMEEYWAWWSRQIYFNRYVDAPSNVYSDLKEILKDTDYFVLTTNVDHQFQRAGFDKQRLFYTQGDYGLFQSIHPRVQTTYDNREIVEKMLHAQGFVQDDKRIFQLPFDKKISMTIPSELIPICPDDGEYMTTNLRCDDTFVEDEGWHQAADRYADFLQQHQNGHILYWELGVGMNTPGIIKFPFWHYTKRNKKAFYTCVNKGDTVCSKAIQERSICLNADIAQVLKDLKEI